MSKEIIVQTVGAGFSIAIPAEITAKKTELLALAKEVKTVATADEQQTAIQIVAKLKGLTKSMESTREQVKKSFLEAGRAIDAKAKEFSGDIESRTKEIEKLIGEFQRQEREKIEAQRREEERKRQEAEAAARKAQEDVEKARLLEVEASAAKVFGQSLVDAAHPFALAELARIKQARLEAEFDAAEAQDELAAASAVVVAPEPPKAQGASVKVVYDYEITDMEALYEWDQARRKAELALNHRHLAPLVKMEERRRELLEYISVTNGAGIPGVKIGQSTKAAVRASY